MPVSQRQLFSLTLYAVHIYSSPRTSLQGGRFHRFRGPLSSDKGGHFQPTHTVNQPCSEFAQYAVIEARII